MTSRGRGEPRVLRSISYLLILAAIAAVLGGDPSVTLAQDTGTDDAASASGDEVRTAARTAAQESRSGVEDEAAQTVNSDAEEEPPDGRSRRERRGRRDLSRSEQRERVLQSVKSGNLGLSADHMWITPDETETAYLIAGNLTVASTTFTLQADNAVIWVEEDTGNEDGEGGTEAADDGPPTTDDSRDDAAGGIDDADGSGESIDADEEAGAGLELPMRLVRQIYAEGDIILTFGDEVFRTERLIYDMQDDRLYVVDGHLKVFAETDRRGKSKRIPLYVRADVIRQNMGVITAEDAFVSTCGWGPEVFQVRAEEVKINLPGEDDDRDESTFHIRKGIATAWGIPVLYLPSVSGNGSTGVGFYFKRARVGRSSQFGTYLETEWGDDIKFGPKGDRTKVGDWTAHIDPLEKRGLGLGLDIDYKADSGFGRIRSYYIHDNADTDRRGRTTDPTTGKRVRIPIDNPNRGRFRLQYRHFLPWDVEGTVEASWLSDPNFLREYYEREFKQGKEQETIAYLKKVVGNQSFTILQKNRLNDFLETTEYMPQAEHRVFEQPVLPELYLGTNLYYSSRSIVGNVRTRPSSEGPPIDPIDQTRVTRFDTQHQLSTPFDVGPAVIRPFFRAGFSTFSETRADDGSTNRFSAAGGSSISTQFHRAYDASNDLLQLDGLRHVINPIATYVNRYANTVGSVELIPHDEIEDLDKVEFIRWQVRNRLQTHRDDTIDDFIDFDTAINMFLDKDRDNNGRTWGNLENDVWLRLRRSLLIFFESEWDFEDDDFDVLNTGVSTSPFDGLTARVSYRQFRESSRTLNAQLGIRLNEKWSAQLLERYNFTIDENQNFGVVFARRGCEWITEVGFTHDSGDDDTKITLNLVPAALYKGPSRRRGSWENELYDPLEFDDTEPDLSELE